MEKIFKVVFVISMLFILLKDILGYYFPWNKCPCCGKRLDKNHKPLSCRSDIGNINKQLDKEIENEFIKWDIADKKWEKSDNNK